MKRFKGFMLFVVVILVVSTCLISCGDTGKIEVSPRLSLTPTTSPTSAPIGYSLKEEQYRTCLIDQEALRTKLADAKIKLESVILTSEEVASVNKEIKYLNEEILSLDKTLNDIKILIWRENPNWIDSDTGRTVAEYKENQEELGRKQKEFKSMSEDELMAVIDSTIR